MRKRSKIHSWGAAVQVPARAAASWLRKISASLDRRNEFIREFVSSFETLWPKWLSPPAWIVVPALLGFAGPAAAQIPAPPALPVKLTIEDALRIFRASGLDLIIADAAVSSAEGDVKAAGAILNPSVTHNRLRTFTWRPSGYIADPVTGQLTDVLDTSCVENGATCKKNGFLVDYNDQGALFDIVSGKRSLRLSVARSALEAARQNRADAQRTIEFQVKQQYIQAVLARDLLGFVIEVQKRWTQTLDLHQLRYKVGEISEADLAKVEAAKLEADQAVATARQALDVARFSLGFLLGVRGQTPRFEVEWSEPKYVVPPKLASATSDSLLAEALQQRPDLKALGFQRDSAAAAVQLARRQRFPAIALDTNYTQIGSGGLGTNAPAGVPTLSVGATATLPLFYRQQGEIQKAQAALRTQEAQRAKIEAQILNEVSAAFANFVAAKELVERMQARLLDRAGRSRDLAELQYRNGAVSLLEFLDAERTYIAVNQEYFQDLANYWTAVFQLEQAVGAGLR